MKQKSVGMTLRAFIIALALILVAGSPALPPFDGVAYAQDAPQNLTATVSPDGSNVLLSWGAVTDADSYEVWRGDGSGGTVSWGTSALATETGTTHTDSTVTAGSTYSYAVRAVEDGTAGAWSNVPSVTIPGGTAAPTDAPTVSVAADGHSAVNVSWTPVTGATGYQVQYWHAGLNDWEQISGNQTSPYNHSGLTAGTQYYYVVRGVNAGGNGPWSNWRTDDSQITLEATTAVPELTLTHVSRNVVRLDWSATTNAANYDLQRKKVVTGGGVDAGSYARLPSALLSGTTLTYTDSAATFGTITGADTTTRVMYHYRVQARDSGGIGGDWSNEVMVSIPETGQLLPAPAQPTTPSVSNSSIRVEWAEVADATYYQIRWKTGDGSYSTPMRVDGLVYTHTGLTPSTAYTYQVRAVNINGAGDWSPERTTSTQSGVSSTGELKMPKVTGLRAVEDSTENADGTRTIRIKLTWNAVSSATHYDIMRFNPGAPTPTWAPPTADGDAIELATGGRLTVAQATSSPTWTDTIATTATNEGAGQTYYYVVSAVDDGPDDAVATDDDLGEWSDYDKVTLKDYKPPTPDDLTPTPTGQTSVWVSWDAAAFDRTATVDLNADPQVFPTGASTMFKLQWRRDGQAYRDRDVVTTTGMTYHHTGLSANTIYWYRVLAENSGGMSAYTDEEMAKTLPQRLTPPGNRSAVDATNATGARITVSWDAVTGASGYEIQRFGAGTDDNMWGDLAGTVPSQTESGVTTVSGTMVIDDNDNDPAADKTSGDLLDSNTTYHYRVRTVVGDVQSEWSGIVSGTTKHGETAAPALVATTTGTSMIRLSWSAVAGATNYELEYVEGVLGDAPTATPPTGFSNPRISRMDMTLGGNDRNFVHMNLKSGTRYSYRLRAVLPQGVYSAWSTVQQPYTQPDRPMLSATATISTTMVLTWDAVEFVTEAGDPGHLDTADGSNYQVQRRVSGTTDWVAVEESPSCDPDTNECMLTDENLSGGTLYWYRIRAVTTTTPVLRSYWDQENQRTPSQ